MSGYSVYIKKYPLSERIVVVLFTLFLFMSSVLGQSHSDTTSLRFHWKPGLSAQIEIQHSIYQKGLVAESVSNKVAMRMNVLPFGKNDLLIQIDDFKFVELSMANKYPPQMLLQLIPEVVPSFHVSMEGELLGVHDFDIYKAYLDSLFTPLFISDTTGEAKMLFQEVMSEEILNSRISAQWGALVGAWTGLNLSTTSTYERRDTLPLPMVPGISVPWITQYSMRDHIECQSNIAVFECVELQMTSRPDPDSVNIGVQRFLDQLGSLDSVDMPVFEKLHTVDEVIVLIARPESLLPYELTISYKMEGIMRVDGQRFYFSGSDNKSFQFNYDYD